jgi:hypothetical protein
MAENLKRLVYRTFSDSLTPTAGTDTLKLITFTSDKFALELFLDIEFNTSNGSNLASFLLEINESGKFFVRNFNISSSGGLASFNPELSFLINSGSIYLKTTDNTFYSITAKKLIKYGDVVDPSISASTITGSYTDLNLLNSVSGFDINDNPISYLTSYGNYTNELKVDGRLLVNGSASTVRVEDFIITNENTENFLKGDVVQKIVTPFIEVTEGFTSVTLDSLNVDYTSNESIPPVIITSNDGATTLLSLDKDGNLILPEGNLSLPVGSLDVGTTLTSTGLSSLNGGIAVDTNKFTVATNGNTTVAGTLQVAGTLAAAGITTLSEDLLIKDGSTTRVTIDNTSGNISTAGSLTVSGGNIFCANTDGSGTFNIGSANLSPVNATLNLGSQPIVNPVGDGYTSTRTINIGTNGALGTDTTVNIGSALEDPAHSIINLYGTVNVIGGTGSAITTETLNVTDNEIVLNANTTTPLNTTSGIVVNRGSEPTYIDATLYWNELVSRWEASSAFSSPVISSTGTLSSVGDFSINSDKFNVTAASGNTLVAGTLGVTGITTITGLSNLNGGIAVATDKFTVGSNGNTLVGGTLAVSGIINTGTTPANNIIYTGSAIPSNTDTTLNYTGILRSSQLFEGSTRVLTAATGNILDASITNGDLTYAPYASATADNAWVSDNANSGKFYLGTQNPTKETRLNYNGIIYASKFIPTNSDVESVTANTTLNISHAYTLVNINTSNPVTITVPKDVFTIGTEIAFFRYGSGTVTFQGATDVTLRFETGKNKIKAQYTSAAIKQIANNEWALVGNLTA